MGAICCPSAPEGFPSVSCGEPFEKQAHAHAWAPAAGVKGSKATEGASQIALRPFAQSKVRKTGECTWLTDHATLLPLWMTSTYACPACMACRLHCVLVNHQLWSPACELHANDA